VSLALCAKDNTWIVLAFYGSSKAALHAIADALSEEIRPFGIRVVNAIPGGVRTQSINNIKFVGDAQLGQPDTPPKVVLEYSEMHSKIREYFKSVEGKENGDATKVAQVILDIVRREGVAVGRSDNVCVFLGSDAKRDVIAACQATLKNLEEWGDVAESTDVALGDAGK